MNIKNIALLTGSLLLAGSGFTQEKTYSQYYSNRMAFNPAMTGIAKGTNVVLNYNSRFNNVNMPFRAFAAGAESRFKSVGFGGFVNSQSSGDGGFKTTNIVSSFAYHLPLDSSNLLSFGLQGGAIIQSFDISKLTFASQYSSAFGPVFPSGEVFSNNRSSAVDINAGLFYSNNGNGKIRPFAGVAVTHINQPEQKITAITSTIPLRYMVHGGASIKASQDITLTPHLAYFQQAKANLFSAGLNVKLDLTGEFDGIYFGGNYRNNDAVTFLAGTVYKDLAIGFSYDVSVGNTSSASIGQQAVEFSINYFFNKGNTKHFSFPRF